MRSIIDADSKNPALASDLLSFFFDRLKVQLRDQGARHDLVDAVLAQQGEGQDDLLLIVRRVEALGKFLATDDGKSLLAGVKRAANILRIEEKKDGKTYHGKPDNHLYLQPEERQLAAAINAVKEEAAKAVAREDFEGAMAVIAKLRPDVDAFFDKVTVNVEMADRRENRLKLLNEIREATAAVADFSAGNRSGTKQLLAFESIAPCNGFKLHSDRVHNGNHRPCFEYKSREGRAELVNGQRIVAVHQHIPAPIAHSHHEQLDLEIVGRLPLSENFQDALLGILVLHRRSLRALGPTDHVFHRHPPLFKLKSSERLILEPQRCPIGLP